MREPWIVTSRDGSVRERVLAKDANEAHYEAEQALKRQGREVPPSTEMVAERERRVTSADYGREES